MTTDAAPASTRTAEEVRTELTALTSRRDPVEHLRATRLAWRQAHTDHERTVRESLAEISRLRDAVVAAAREAREFQGAKTALEKELETLGG